MTQSEFVGVDGCHAGWFSVGLSRNGGYELKVFPDFKALLEHYDTAELILVDIPIGLPEGPGGRVCDREARKKLGWPRMTSVFQSPTRCTVEKAFESPKDRKAADDVERRCAGKGLTFQAFSIAPKIAEVYRVMVGRGDDETPRIREVHPEVCFWALNKRTAMSSRKQRAEGREDRLRVLGGVEPNAKKIYDEGCSKFLRKDIARDDILDALAAAVTAHRGTVGGALRTLPEIPPRDAKCIPMEMVFWEHRKQGRVQRCLWPPA